MQDSLPLFAFESLKFTDNGRIIFASEKEGRNHLYSIDADGGAAQLLTPGDFDVEEVTLSGDRKSILYTSNQNDVDRRHIWRVSATGGDPQALTSGETIEWNPVGTSDGKNLLCLGSTATSPAMAYRVTASGRELIAKSLITALPEPPLVTPKQVFQKRGWPRNSRPRIHTKEPEETRPRSHLHARRTDPADAARMALHAVLPQRLRDESISGEQRLHCAFGELPARNHDRRAFRDPPHSVWRGASECQDVVAGAKFLQTLENVDPHRIGLWGGSYGGTLTAMGLARNSDIFKAGVDFHGVHDWAKFCQCGCPRMWTRRRT